MPEPNREQQIFAEAWETASPAERATFLASACAGDEALLARVEALLRASNAPATFLPGEPTKRSEHSVPWSPSSVTGRYRLLDRIGEGGFGVVYLAEQSEPIRRRVALKVIKPGMDSRQVIGRFEVERQALALMDHSNIARIFDAGTIGLSTATPQSHGESKPQSDFTRIHYGRPFFAMELVEGPPITKFCGERQLDVIARIRLFLDVCAAVQHAHQKGILHRDLKPSNILVTLHGEKAVPKVIDFGIAKALGEPLGDTTALTQFQEFLGTPAYMSPEQATSGGLDVDTRSDIYGLGILLYELLTGEPPFDSKELLRAGWDELRRTIREREPERPSTRLAKRHPHSANGAARFLAKRNSPIARELDLIVLKCLEKDRDRRYPTANGLAADLRRFLNHEPVTAVAPTLSYQAAKFFRRHWMPTLTALAFAVVLLVASVVSMGLAIRARRAEALAAREAATAWNVSEFQWKELIKPLTPWVHTNRAISLRAAFDLAADNIEKRLAHHPLAEAAVRLSFAKAYIGLSEWSAAETNLLRALELREAHAGRDNDQTADILYQLGILREFLRQPSEAERLFLEAAGIRGRVLSPHHPDTVMASAKGRILRAGHLSFTEAEALLRTTLEELRLAVGESHSMCVTTLNHLGLRYLQQGRSDDAFELFTEAHRAATQHQGHLSSDALWCLALIAETRERQGRLDEAERSYRDLIDLREQVNGTNHFFTLGARLAHAQVLAAQDRLEEAAPILLGIAQAAPPDRRPLDPIITQVIKNAIARWRANGGGAGFEEFRREARNLLPATVPLE